ncbi:hypothetical protein MAHJHV63_51460 [Mycobacterium avium subsp. hominissuis]
MPVILNTKGEKPRMRTCFIADGTAVYGITATGRIHIADTDSESWAETIVEALNKDPDVYVV